MSQSGSADKRINGYIFLQLFNHFRFEDDYLLYNFLHGQAIVQAQTKENIMKFAKQDILKTVAAIGADGFRKLIEARVTDAETNQDFFNLEKIAKSTFLTVSSVNDGNNTWETVFYFPEGCLCEHEAIENGVIKHTQSEAMNMYDYYDRRNLNDRKKRTELQERIAEVFAIKHAFNK